ncbi:MAG TPA: zf-HC2 domain-containing protein [Bacteroidota bacterium]|nr:zf-HC2 domain-containing protein [Bacteroidota bacterium]
MTHTRMYRLLSAYADNELGENESREVRQHLETCTTCQQRLQEMRSIRTKIREAATVDLPDNFIFAVQRSIRREEQESVVWLGTERFARNVFVVLTVLVFAVVLLGNMLKPQQAVGVDRYLSGEVTDSAAHAVLGSQQAISKDDVMMAALSR